MSVESSRLESATWKKWGPYVAERSWGTVREDYSWNGDAWHYFPQDQAISRAYRWGEDGIAGWCDRYQVVTFSSAFWNGKDPILKERLYGLSNEEGNHGEDVKECYYYLDATPTHSYMKYLYKYPHARYPYEELAKENRRRGQKEPEYELIDTGVFANNAYFDIFIEYAKASEEDTCIKVQAFNRGSIEADLHIIPQIWFRNQWSWGETRLQVPEIVKAAGDKAICLALDGSNIASPSSLAFNYNLGKFYLYSSLHAEVLFTDNETRQAEKGYYKDGFHRFIVNKEETVRKDKGTKAGLHYTFSKMAPGGSVEVYLRLTTKKIADPLADVEKIVTERKKEADDFYKTVHPKKATTDECLIQRQALAGMLWNKQIYLCDIQTWMDGDNPKMPPPANRNKVRNEHWHHLNSMRILSMPDKWEYPWFAAWDLAFHSLTLALVDMEFAKEQLWLLLFDQFQHPNGQIPAYEWEFSEMNPPVQAWAAYRLYSMEKDKTGKGDIGFLKRCLHKLLINFAWWVNKVDTAGNNVFEGGFLGLDNIAIVDRSEKFPGGAHLEQSDGTGWMAMFCLNLMRISLEIAKSDKTYESLATKFFQHFVYVAHAIQNVSGRDYSLWSEEDGFFYDVLVYPNGAFDKFRMRSLVGLIPLYAVDIITEEELDAFPEFKTNFTWFMQKRRHLVKECVIEINDNGSKKYLLSLVTEKKLSHILSYVWNSEEFLSPYGLRSLSKYHEKNPFCFKDKSVGYEPGESDSKLKGGNSNWRGPIWFPTTYLFIDSMKVFGAAFPKDTKFPSENGVTLEELARVFTERLISIFKEDKTSGRPFRGKDFPFLQDPHWKDYILFNEYFHGDTGKGLGSSHQTGWTGLVANLIDKLKG